MAGKGKPKTGGRLPGSLNLGPRSLGRKRDRVRRDVTKIIQDSMPQLRGWLSSAETWKSDGAKAAALMDTMMRWVLPSYGRIDPHMEQAAAAAAELPKAPPVTAESVLEAFKGLGSVKASLATMLERGTALPEPTAITRESASRPAEVLPELRRLRETESDVIRHSGIPLDAGRAYLPKAPEMPRRREPGAMPDLPKPAIEHDDPEYLTPDEIRRACMRPLPDDDGSFEVVVTPAGPVARPRW